MTYDYEDMRRAAALMYLDIKVFAMAYPNNPEIQKLFLQAENIINDRNLRDNRFEKSCSVVSLKRHNEFLETLPEDSLKRGFFLVPEGLTAR